MGPDPSTQKSLAGKNCVGDDISSPRNKKILRKNDQQMTRLRLRKLQLDGIESKFGLENSSIKRTSKSDKTKGK